MGMQGAWEPTSDDPRTTRDPREGSAAWKAEQIATGNMSIPLSGSRPMSFDSPARTEPTTDAGPLIGLLLKLLVPVAIIAAVWFQFFRSTAPSAEEIEAAFVPLTGYEYASESPAADVAESYVSNYPGFEDEISDLEVKGVSQGGRPIGVVMIGGFEYSDDKQADFDSAGQSLPVTAVSLGTPGHTFSAFEVAQPPAYGYMWLDDDGYFFVVMTNFPTHARTLATALGTAQL